MLILQNISIMIENMCPLKNNRIMENIDGCEEIGGVRGRWKSCSNYFDVGIQVKFIAGKVFFGTKDGQQLDFWLIQ